ncbi:MAG: hypothetical protein JJU09_11455 [Rhodobacteraceae bacterium]|nr:hypothetical protein [Paracoccaceae bacterium]
MLDIHAKSIFLATRFDPQAKRTTAKDCNPAVPSQSDRVRLQAPIDRAQG